MNSVLEEIAQSVLSLPREAKRAIVLTVDISFCVLSVWLAYYLRLGEFIPLAGRPMLAAGGSVLLAIPLVIVSGLYRAIFRFSGLPTIISLVRAIGVYGLIYTAMFTAIGVEGIPWTIGLIQPMLLLLLVGTSRAFAKLWLGGEYQSRWKRATLPQLLI